MAFPSRPALHIGLVVLTLFAASAAPAAVDQQASSATDDILRGRLDAIRDDLARFQRQILAANTASNPAARAAAIEQATGTLARLIKECREVEQLYAGLKTTLPPKTGASAATATAALESIVTDLEASAGDLDKARTSLASLP